MPLRTELSSNLRNKLGDGLGIYILELDDLVARPLRLLKRRRLVFLSLAHIV